MFHLKSFPKFLFYLAFVFVGWVYIFFGVILFRLFFFLLDITGLQRAYYNWKLRKYEDNSKAPDSPSQSKIDQVIEAFKNDGFNRDDYRASDSFSYLLNKFNRLAFKAFRLDPNNRRNLEGELIDPGGTIAKRSYYCEGSHYQMGYQLGYMAEFEVSLMANQYVNRVIFSFFGAEDFNTPEGIIFQWLGNFIADILYLFSLPMNKDIPRPLLCELYGLWKGSQDYREAEEKFGRKLPNSNVKMRDLRVLNFGIDILLSLVYASGDTLLKALGFPIKRFNPMLCNGVSIFGERARNGHYVGRDFMFPTAGVFTETASHVIYRHVANTKEKQDPAMVCGLAPGMIGTITALSDSSIAVGVDMVASRNCSGTRIGLNSLPMVRHVVNNARSAEQAVDVIRTTRRGVSWIYFVADGGKESGIDSSVVVEATKTTWGSPKFYRYMNKQVQKFMPSKEDLLAHWEQRKSQFRGEPFNNSVQAGKGKLKFKAPLDYSRGIMARWFNWPRDDWFYQFNEKLFLEFGKVYRPNEMGSNGFLSPIFRLSCECLGEAETPGCYTTLPYGNYFAPLRTGEKPYQILTNLFITPEMRMWCMNPFTSLIPGENHQFIDFQWRYDMLNWYMHDQLDKHQSDGVGFDEVREAIYFLKPYDQDGKKAKNFDYYGVHCVPSDSDPKKKVSKDKPMGSIEITGITSVIDLKELRIESHYGYFIDEKVETHLANYLV